MDGLWGPARFAVTGRQLAIGGNPISRLAARIGSTPFFAYDRSLITGRVAGLRRVLPSGVELSYLITANSMPPVVHHLAGQVDSLGVASATELATALNTGVGPDRISYTGSGKAIGDVERAVAAGVILEVDSITEVNRVAAAGLSLSVQPRLAVRVDPDSAIEGTMTRTGGCPPQAGVDLEHVPAVLDRIADLDLDLIGFHVLAGSQNLRTEIICEAQRRGADLIIKLAAGLADPIGYLKLSGGFGIPYAEEDAPLDLAPVAENLAMLVDGIIATHLPQTTTVIELGRYLVGESGVYVTRVLDRKESQGRVFLIVDGGPHQQPRISDGSARVSRINHPIAVGHRITEPPDEVVTIVSRFRPPLDLLADRVVLPRTDIGDLIVFFQAGAYGLTADSGSFLGYPAPAEVLV